MKRTVLFLTCFCLFASFVLAEPIDKKIALQIAREFVPRSSAVKKAPKKGAATTASDIVYTHKMPKSGRDAFYIVNVGDAFVLVSADDIAHQVLGYSFDKGFPMEADGSVQLPSHVKGFFDDLAAQMEAAIEAEPNRVADDDWSGARHAPSNHPESVGPLLTTTWNQGQYYNALCPEDADGPDGHVLTGCVATAMAQIIKYWGEPVHGRGTHSYNLSNLDPASMGYDISNYGTLSANFEDATYEFNQMPDILTSESSPEEVSAVAQLMFHCGVSVNMEYGASSSGARNEDVRSALISYFGFTPTLGLANRQLYSDEEWEDSLRANIDRGEPVYYSGSGLFGSHAFVLDGYKQDGYFHFNFGWGGDCDGWYLTKAVNPGFEYNEWQSAIMGIRPNSNSHAVICHRTMYVQNNDRFTVTEPIDLYPMRGGSLYRATNEDCGVRINLELVPKDSNGQLVLDVLDFGMEQSVVIYDGINKDSLVRVIETRNLDDWSTVTYHTWFYEGQPEDSIFQNMAGTDFSPIVSTRHGFNVVVYSYGGIPESFRLQVRNSTDINPNTPSINDNIYWTDVVTSEPDGYLLDGDTIRITSAEGLAWVSHYLDSIWLVGTEWEVNQFNHHFISIENDLDLAGYLWKPIRAWFGNIEGHGHVITNMKVSTSGYGGLFSTVFNAKISNIGMANSKVNATNCTGSLVGYMDGCTVENCYTKDYTISAGNTAECGGLIGSANGGSIINNCYAYGSNYSQFGYGGIVGYFSYSEMHNCVSRLGESYAWRYMIDPPEWRGLLTEEAHDGIFSNCFSDISAFMTDNIMLAANRMYLFLGNWYNVNTVENLAAFNLSTNTLGVLNGDIAVNYSLGDNMDVITALNSKVTEYNLPNLRTWVRDNETHMPVFGDFYEVTCPSVSNIAAENIVYNDGFAVALSWQENGEAIEWQVKYNIKNAPEEDATVFITNDTRTIIEGLQLGNEYGFYVRPLLNGEATIGWGQPFYFYVDKTLWIDMVTECPEGYYEDSNGNVTISSPEGLAWLAKIGFISRQDTISIVDDLDMGAYKWIPLSHFGGVIEGNNHIISNLYCTENLKDDKSENIGLVGSAENASFNNIIIKNGLFVGNHYVGSLFGIAWNSTIKNCHTINVCSKGLYVVGGLGGDLRSDAGYGVTINSSSSGFVYGDQGTGGLFGSKSGDMINCYSNCTIQPLGIRNERSYEGRGGLCGTAGCGNIKNCYSVGSVGTHINDYENVVGSALGQYGYGNLQYVYIQEIEGLSIVGTLGDECLLSDTSSLVDNTLQPPVTIDGTSYTDLADALNAWVDANNSEGLYRHWVADTENVNGGFPVFAPLYTLTYKVDGEIYMTSSLEAGAALSAIAEPTKEGYVFSGWSELPETMPDHDVVVTGTFYRYGDVNSDGFVDLSDAIMVTYYSLHEEPSNFNEAAADMNGDGEVDLSDAIIIIYKSLGVKDN